jgi:hypothetical protein
LSGPEKASGFAINCGEDTLSMAALIELLRAVTEKGKPFRFQATGFSMYPFIRNLDTITVSPLPAGGRCRLGDVVAFLKPGTEKLAVHRVIRKKGDCYLIRGDNTPEPDGLISAARMLGYVTNVERGGRQIRVGLGPERAVIACLSRKDLIRPSLFLACRLARPFIRRTII